MSIKNDKEWQKMKSRLSQNEYSLWLLNKYNNVRILTNLWWIRQNGINIITDYEYGCMSLICSHFIFDNNSL